MDGGPDQVSALSPAEKRERPTRQPRSYPLSFAQQRLWLLNEMEGGSTVAYNIPVALRLEGPLDLATLE
ncbi:MAG TPA: hypothetical protein VNI02_02935, partial [Blastocatellia bacterium]|nr:hypothetical protein [Blastocatellia bacterium]